MSKIMKSIVAFSLALLALTGSVYANERAGYISLVSYCVTNEYGETTCTYVSIPAGTRFESYGSTATWYGKVYEYYCYHDVNSTKVYGTCKDASHP